ncbi:MAG TPA: hypothetical protein VLA31_08570, partial [Burkholderiaceae bacterium]|nr:hypothetical protein [Burkholderiaceae bacterium]
LLTVMLNGLALTALTHAVCRAVIGHEPSVREVYRDTLRGRIVPPILVYLLLNFLVSFPLSPGLLLGNAMLFMLGLFPALFAGALFFPALPASVVEWRGTISALGRSVSLVKGKLPLGVAAFGYYVFITVFLPTLILSIQLTAGIGPLTPLLFALISSVTLPLGYAAPMLVYLSRIAEEGATPTNLAEALGLLEPPPHPDQPQGEEPRGDDPGNDGPHAPGSPGDEGGKGNGSGEHGSQSAGEPPPPEER